MKKAYKILIVDDSKFVNSVLKSEFISLNKKDIRFEILQAFSLEDAKNILSDNRDIDFILLDLILPDGEGEELITIVGQNSKTKVIVLTSDSDKARREHLFQLGALDYFSKDNPINFTVNECVKLITKLEINQNITVLVVDDSNFSRHYMSDIFRNRNYTILTASNGKEALQVLFKNPYINLMVLDLEMPIMSGEKVIHSIRRNNNFLNLPIVVLSGTSNDNLIAKVLKNGANEFLKKPFSIEELVLKSEIFISLGQTQRELLELNATLESRVKREIERNRSKDRILELQSRQAQMGEMISSVAHQWKQPLNILSIMALDMKFEYEGGDLNSDYVDKYIEDVMKQVKYMTNTIDDFKNFFKPMKDKREFSIVNSCRRVLDLVGKQYIYDDLDIQVKGNSDIKILGYQNEFEQVIINFLNNSRDVIKEKNIKNKTIIIDIEEIEKVVNIRIKDFAGGVDNSIIDTIFEPYISTKGEKGTGIGLYMSKTIIDKLGGSIDILNSEQGAEFLIKIENKATN